MNPVTRLDRRTFVRLGAFAGGGLFLGVYAPGRLAAEPADSGLAEFRPNAFVRIGTDDSVTIWLARSDMGQGVRTSLPMIVADEMDADWSRVTVEQADAHPSRYGRMMTVGSGSVRGGAWMPLRQAGAAAREMLVAAAAARWGVAASTLRTENGRVHHDASKKSATYGDLADAASAIAVPEKPRLKDPSAFRLIGKRIPLVDTNAKVTGGAKYGIDARTPGMRFGTVVHPPAFGDSVESFDAAKALAVKGVTDVFEVSQGVAVVADNTWAAFKGAKALDIRWKSGGFTMSSDEIFRHFAQIGEQDGESAVSTGNPMRALTAGTRKLSAVYQAPYLAHATMEPMNCTADVKSDRCEIWVPSQNPQGAQTDAARMTGLPVEAVTVHVQYLGCGWGRRSHTDFVQDAVEASMKVKAPVQVLWTREEDMQHDFYRPAARVQFEGALDEAGHLSALHVKSITPAFGGQGRGVDRNSVDGLVSHPYTIPNVAIDYVRPDVAVPVSYWRSVGPSQNVFFMESFIDEMAHAAGADPVDFRLAMLDGEPRLKHALEVVRQRSGWATKPAAGRARGAAVVMDKGGIVAQIAEVSIESGRIRVHRVTCAYDCGRVIHPGIVEAQVTGSIVGGLTAALYGEITIDKGRVAQGNFNDYPMLRMNEMPVVDVHIVPSEEEPGGAGEPALPPIAPAVANAVFALTGTRLRSLPLRPSAVQTDGPG
jgi:isoquinoline 1-oxidoreductase subunit beta